MEFFFGVFDNDEARSLPNLKEEHFEIQNAMIPLEIDGKCICHTPYNLGIDKIIDRIRRFKDVMTWFHFSGHHDKGIKMNDGEFTSLAKNLEDCPKLKAIFINGCVSMKTLEKLASKVPILIGTTDLVYDSIAIAFSKLFYKELCTNDSWDYDTIHSIFEKTKGNVKDILNSDSAQGMQRGGGASMESSLESVHIISPNTDEAKKLFETKQSKAFDIKKVNVNEFIDNYSKKHFDEHYRNPHQDFPYFLSISLRKILTVPGEQLNSDLIRYRDINVDRFELLKTIHIDLINFLKFSVYSLIWKAMETEQFTLKLSPEQKTKLKANLKQTYFCNQRQIRDLVEISELIPKPVLEKEAIFQDIVNCLKQNYDFFIEWATIFQNSISNDPQYQPIIFRAQSLFEQFLVGKSFEFLKSTSICSISDVLYYQYRFHDQPGQKARGYEVKLSYFLPDDKPDIPTVKPDSLDVDTLLDVGVHSIYLQHNDKRVLNLSPFFYDKNSETDNAGKINLCYLSKFSPEREEIRFKEILDRDESKVIKDDDNKSRKKLHYQLMYFWNAIS